VRYALGLLPFALRTVPCAVCLAPVAFCLIPMSDMMRLVHKQTQSTNQLNQQVTTHE